jgi:cyclase
MVCWPLPVVREMHERQEDFVSPNLSPKGLGLHPRELADGVYALLANREHQHRPQRTTAERRWP